MTEVRVSSKYQNCIILFFHKKFKADIHFIQFLKMMISLEMCVDNPKWVDDKYGNGKSNCDKLTHEWCHDYGRYSTEAQIWCPETCKMCDHVPKKGNYEILRKYIEYYPSTIH